MLRLGNIVGLVIGGLIGYLCSFDIDNSLGSIKLPFYISVGATFGWLAGSVHHWSQPGESQSSVRDR